MKYLIFCLFLSPLLSFSCESINFGYVSHHYKSYYELDKKYNERNYGFGCSKIFNSDLDFSYFKNSYGDKSISLSKFYSDLSFYSSSNFDINFGLQMGLLYGYNFSIPIVPYALPRLDINFDKKVTFSFIILASTGIAATVNFKL